MINVVGVTHHYGIRPVLRNLNFRVAKGDLVALMGPNGMGKTTLLALMAGVLSPLKGYVEIGGKRRRGSVDEELAIRKQVAYLPDHPWLPSHRSGREFLLGVGRLYDIDHDRLMDHVDRLLRLFQLGEQGDAPIRSYSNGQKKKLSVCAALVSEAPIMLLDEPFSGGLDPSALFALKRVMKRLAERDDVTVVMATQVPELVEGVAERVAVLREGEIIAYDTPEALLRQTGAAELQDALERLISPQTLADIEHYFEEQSK